MAPYIGSQGQDRLISAIARLHRLADDLTRIAGEDMPTCEELENAPILDRYSISERSMECLLGHRLGDGKLVRSDELYFIAPEQGWARTMSGFYRLGAAVRNSRLY